jgi:SAM-dependent methyltransferase
MPDLNWNVRTWSESYDWSGRGEEWSASWGSSAAQWFGSIHPRISVFLPTPSILELAPGFGRWTRFLTNQCQHYVGVDLSLSCIEHCRAEFATSKHAQFHVNDGLSLPMVGDDSCDFVFSFDSLVHVELDILKSYIKEIVRVLCPQGVAFIHHSNWCDAQSIEANRHFRAETVSASLVRGAIEQLRGAVLLQETVNWGSESCIDCFTLFGRASAFPEYKPRLVKNAQFMEEAELIRVYHQPWHTLDLSIRDKAVDNLDSEKRARESG